MKKEQLELCKKVITLFNKSHFKDISGIEIVQFSDTIRAFAKMVQEDESFNEKPIEVISPKSGNKKGNK